MMAPIFPHIADELWHRQGNTSSVHLQRLAETETRTRRAKSRSRLLCRLAARCAINSRSHLVLPLPSFERAALLLPNVDKYLKTVTAPQKVIVVPDKLVNLVL
jgi:leucyl-tRNA synthetase